MSEPDYQYELHMEQCRHGATIARAEAAEAELEEVRRAHALDDCEHGYKAAGGTAECPGCRSEEAA